ncbi:MAG TPA: hypothetical protein VNT30_08500 [Stellaceae bacterium]|nr:hypothetical protein [Stellaceae bacterium]
MASIHILYPTGSPRSAAPSLYRQIRDLPGMLARLVEGRRRRAIAQRDLLALDRQTMLDIGIDRTVVMCDVWKARD